MSHCIKEITLDLKDYQEGGTVFRRKAVRGVIRHEDKYLAICGKYGDYKLPGGGMNQGESHRDTLIREVQEETGYKVLPDSIGDYLLVHEKGRGDPQGLLEMDSWYYFCEVEETAGEPEPDEYEKEYGYRAVWMPLDQMLRGNEALRLHDDIACPQVYMASCPTADAHCAPWPTGRRIRNILPWIAREALVMQELWHMQCR